jgi:DMATS type aromatic prenyltransferase
MQTMSSSAAFQKVVSAEPLANEDQEFWWQATGPSFATLLDKAGYTPGQLEYHLSWYRRFIPASLGRRPVPGQKYPFTAGPCWDGSPVEPSINWKEKSKSTRLVRFAIGAIDNNAGTEADPFGQEETGRLLRRMTDVIPDLSLKKYEIFAEHLFIKKEDQASLLAKMPEGTARVQVWVAFDCRAVGPMAKAYFIPYLKMIETGKHSNDFLQSIAQQCSKAEAEYGSFDQGVATFTSYLDSFAATPELMPRTIIWAIDCIEGPDSRIKSYIATAADTLSKVKELYTLGGRVSGPEADAGLRALTDLWPILFGLESTADMDDKAVFPAGLGACACIELKADRAVPEVKLQLPIYPLGIKARELSSRLSTWFRQRGHGEFADKYASDLEETL